MGATALDRFEVGLGPRRIRLDLSDVVVSEPLSLVRVGPQGPPISLDAEALTLRDPVERSLLANSCLAFLSLLPVWSAAVCLMWLLQPLLSQGPAQVATFALLAVMLGAAPFNGGIRAGDLAEGRWIGWLGWLENQRQCLALGLAAIAAAAVLRRPGGWGRR